MYNQTAPVTVVNNFHIHREQHSEKCLSNKSYPSFSCFTALAKEFLSTLKILQLCQLVNSIYEKYIFNLHQQYQMELFRKDSIRRTAFAVRLMLFHFGKRPITFP